MKKMKSEKRTVFSVGNYSVALISVVLVTLVLCGACLFAVGCGTEQVKDSRCDAKPVFNAVEMNKEAAKALKFSPKYAPLAPGAVKPTGWLLDRAKAAGDGITGHLDERANAFKFSWTGKDFEAKGVGPQGTMEPIEPCAYWLDALIRLGYALDDEYLINKASSRLDIVVKGVLDGGPSLLWWRPKQELDIPFENWAHSHMARALVAYYQASRDPKILEALVRVYRDFPLPDMQYNFPIGGLNGPVNIDPMLEVYSMSGDRKVFDTAMAMTRSAPFKETVARWNTRNIEPGHGVIFYEYLRVPALFYPWTGNKRHLDATLGVLEWNDRNYMLPMGLCSGEEYHAGIGSTRNTETCNIPVSIWAHLWLLRITGEQEHADSIEQIFFNAGPAPVSRDFQIMCYYQSSNRYSTKLPRDIPRDPGLPGAYLFTETGHSTICCTGNITRTLPFYITYMWMTTADRGLAATLYGPCNVKAKVGDGVPVSIECKTAYPFEDEISMTINPQKQTSFPLRLRIPNWCREPSLKVNGKSVEITTNLKGFAVVQRAWKRGDTIKLRLPMTIKVVQGRETPFPNISRFKEYDPNEHNRALAALDDIDNPYTSVYYGPLLFALAIPDENPNKEAPGADYKYALDVTPGEAEKRIEIVRRRFPKHWHWQLDAPIQLKVPAVGFDWKPTALQPLPASPVLDGPGKTVTLVPYGCTKFRVSMFPVTKRAWKLD